MLKDKKFYEVEIEVTHTFKVSVAEKGRNWKKSLSEDESPQFAAREAALDIVDELFDKMFETMRGTEDVTHIQGKTTIKSVKIDEDATEFRRKCLEDFQR